MHQLLPNASFHSHLIIIIIKGIYIAQVRKGHKCAMSYGYVTVYISIAISHITNCQDNYGPALGCL